MQTYIIYKITNLVNSKIYIGRTSIGIKSRFRDHLNRFKTGNYSHLRLYRAFAKYGVENFSIEEIERCNSFQEIKAREGELILSLKSFEKDIGYNMCLETHRGLEFLDQDILERRRVEIHRSHCENIKRSGKFIGVAKAYAKSPSWRACISLGGKKVCFSLPTIEEAAEFYDKLSIYTYGESAILNFPEKKAEYSESISNFDILMKKHLESIREKRKLKVRPKHQGICFHSKHQKWFFTLTNKITLKKIRITIFDSEEDALLSRDEFIENNPDYVISLF